MIDFVELLARCRDAQLAQLVKGQPKEFWEEVGTKLDVSGDGTITMDELMEALRERDLDE